jgi:3-deoxy-D-manno-octulosonic-acid transferase
MARFIYNILLLLIFPLAAPYYALRMWRRGALRRVMAERLGFYPASVRRTLSGWRDVLWVHAVSVGEINLARVLLRELRVMEPGLKVVVTTTTATGRQVAAKLEDAQTVVVFNPFDLFWVVRSFFRLVRPRVLVLMEQEIWPNYLWEARNRGVPVWLVNGRLSGRSQRRFRKAKGWIAPLLGILSGVTLQEAEDEERFAEAGFPGTRLWTTGSMKYDVADLALADSKLAAELLGALGWEGKPVVLAGSTHPGEEELFLKTAKELRAKHPGMKLILAPRHFERRQEVLRACDRNGFRAVLRTEMRNGLAGKEDADVLILDTTGELASAYQAGTVNFIGKSLRGRGGQNFLEAVRTGRPVVFGPHMENFEKLALQFREAGAVVQLEGEGGLASVLDELLGDTGKAAEIGRRGRTLFGQGTGAGRRNAELVAAVWRKQAEEAGA